MDEQEMMGKLESELYSQVFESTQRHLKEKRDKLAQEYSRGGLYHSGPHAKAVIDLELEGLTKLLNSYFDILKRVYFKTKDPDEKFLRTKIEELYHGRIRASKQSLSDYLPRLRAGARHIEDFEREAAVVLSQVLRIIRVTALEGSLKPKKIQEEPEEQHKGAPMTMNEKRDQFLIKLNEISEGKIDKFIETMSIGDALGFDRATAFSYARYFDHKGYIEPRDDAYNTISITAEGIDEANRIQSRTVAPSLSLGNDVFIVHGHDAEAKEAVAKYIEQLGLRAIILHEMPNKGRAVIEKFEDHSNVGFAVVLLTPDDVGTSSDKIKELKPRARQNVIFELGYFVAKLSRERVCVLCKVDVEMPSDYEGILYIKMDKGDSWKKDLVKEMIEAGMKIDPAKLLS